MRVEYSTRAVADLRHSWSCSYRQPPHTMPAVLDQHYGSLRQLFRGLLQHDLEALDYELSPRVAQPKKDHADASSTARGDDLAEIKIECQHDALFPDRLLKRLHRSVIFAALPLGGGWRHGRMNAGIQRPASIRPCRPGSACAISVNRIVLPRVSAMPRTQWPAECPHLRGQDSPQEPPPTSLRGRSGQRSPIRESSSRGCKPGRPLYLSRT